MWPEISTKKAKGGGVNLNEDNYGSLTSFKPTGVKLAELQ